MKGDHNVCDKMASGPNECYPSLTEVNMDKIVQCSTCHIAHEWRQKHEGDNDVSNVIVLFQLDITSASILILGLMEARKCNLRKV